jgi:hypothetical protein
MNQLTDRFFWFSQPSTILSSSDKVLIYIALGLLVFGILIRITILLARPNAVDKKLLLKIWQFGFWIGLSGIIWGALRYEGTPIFAQRYWAGLNYIIGILWLTLILKYLLFKYRQEKLEYNRELMKSKYLPKSR